MPQVAVRREIAHNMQDEPKNRTMRAKTKAPKSAPAGLRSNVGGPIARLDQTRRTPEGVQTAHEIARFLPSAYGTKRKFFEVFKATS